MAWIESHQGLLMHRKTLRASALLKVNKYQLIGHMHALWWWALENAEDDGALPEAIDEEIAEAAGWPTKKASGFVEALVMVGFIDPRDGCYVLHNWWTYAGKLNDKRAKDRERKAEVRATSSGNPAEVAGTNQPTNRTNQPTEEVDTPYVTTQESDPLRKPTNVLDRTFGQGSDREDLERALDEEWKLDYLKEHPEGIRMTPEEIKRGRIDLRARRKGSAAAVG